MVIGYANEPGFDAQVRRPSCLASLVGQLFRAKCRGDYILNCPVTTISCWPFFWNKEAHHLLVSLLVRYFTAASVM